MRWLYIYKFPVPCIVTRLIIDRKLQCYIIEATDIYFYKKENKRQHEKIKDWYMYIKYFIEGHTCVPSRTFEKKFNKLCDNLKFNKWKGKNKNDKN